MPVIGYLDSASPDLLASLVLRAFREGLGQTGYVEGRNMAIEYRWAEGHYDRIPPLIADLVRRQVTVLSRPGALLPPSGQDGDHHSDRVRDGNRPGRGWTSLPA